MNPFINIEDRADWDRLHGLWSRTEPFRASQSADPTAIAWVQALHIPTERDRQLKSQIEQAIRRNGADKRRWFGLDGPANMGKTGLLIYFAITFHFQQLRLTPPATARSGRGDADTGVTLSLSAYRHVPVVYVQADAAYQGAGLLRAICATLGAPTQGTEDTLRARLQQLLPRTRTVLVIVDDAHMLRRVSPRSTRLTDSLRADLRLPVTFVFAGAGIESSALLRVGAGEGYESADQLRTRHSMLFLEPLNSRDHQPMLRKLMGSYLNRVQTMLPWLQHDYRTDNKALESLVSLSQGRVGALMSALKDATTEALHLGLPSVSSDLLMELAGSGIALSSEAPR